MQKCSTCGIELQLSKCPNCGGSPLPSVRAASKSLNKYSFLLVPGLLGSLLGYIVYPPLDAGPLVAFGLCVFFLPMLLQLASVLRKRLSENVGRLRTVYAFSSLVLLLLALLLLLNGWLDGSSPNAVRSTVVQKTVTRRRYSPSYRLTVSSWRPGRSEEEFRVGPRTFNRTIVGKTVTVKLHKGFFGLPWSGSISPE
jgi:hypothetical protein